MEYIRYMVNQYMSVITNMHDRRCFITFRYQILTSHSNITFPRYTLNIAYLANYVTMKIKGIL